MQGVYGAKGAIVSEEIELPASAVAVGHCVIMNDVEQPCTKMVVVLTSVKGDRVTGRYLAQAINFGECSGPVSRVTPVNAFGMRVMLSGGAYKCEPDESLGRSAVYPDGDPRKWQDHCEPYWRAAVDKWARVAIKASEQS